MNRIDFFKTFIKDKNVGAVTKTSRFAVQKVCSHIDFSRDITVIEYGPGEGVFTRYLLSRLSPSSKLIAIDTNRTFIDHLASTPDGRLYPIEGSVQNVKIILAGQNILSVDYVISGIPFTFLAPNMRKAIVANTYSALKPGGKFLVYQYSPLMKHHLDTAFGSTKTQFIPLNLPSMFIMAAQKN